MYIRGIISIIKVFIAYFVLIIMLTAFVLKPVVGKRNIFERFVLYLVVGNFYIINFVFVLAYLNVFNRISIVVTLLAVSFLIRILLDKKEAKRIYLERKETLMHLIHGEYGKKLYLQRKLSNARAKIRSFCHELFEGKKLEWIIFLSIMGYNCYYYGYNNVHYVSFAAPDEEVHLYWIQSLIRGDIFPKGIYPHGFHNILAAISVFFGFNAVTVIRSFGVISMVLVMTMLYIGLRKVLRSKYAALFGFLAYSLLNIYEIQSIYRYQFAIPQEYGMIMLMPMILFLFNYLKTKRMVELLLFGISFSLTISIHFYITIIALVLCLAIGLTYLYTIFKERLFIRLVICGIMSSMIAASPLVLALSMGHEMEQSMNWAKSVIQGKEYGDEVQLNSSFKELKQSFQWNTFLNEAENDITKYVFSDIRVMYFFLSILVGTLFLGLLLLALGKSDEENLKQISLALYGLILIFLILCRALKLPTVMEPKRIAIFLAYFSSLYMAIPIEIIYKIFTKVKLTTVGSVIALIFIPMLVFIIIKYDFARPLPPFYYFQTKGAMLVDNDIMEKYEDYEWTIVAPINDLSVILNKGRHEELSDFILKQENWNKNMNIKIPTKYVFIYIEKRPIALYGNRFFKNDKEIVNRDLVTYQDALTPLREYLEESREDNVLYKSGRKTLMAKAYYWALQYKEYFPKEMSVYYEDDELIVYRIVQNEHALNNFAINYGVNEVK
jgi:hypothetical protein